MTSFSQAVSKAYAPVGNWVEDRMDTLTECARPLTDWAVEKMRGEGMKVTPLGKAAAPHLASRAIVMLIGGTMLGSSPIVG